MVRQWVRAVYGIIHSFRDSPGRHRVPGVNVGENIDVCPVSLLGSVRTRTNVLPATTVS